MHCSDWPIFKEVSAYYRSHFEVFQQRIQQISECSNLKWGSFTPANRKPPAVTKWLQWWWRNQLVLVTFLLLFLQVFFLPNPTQRKTHWLNTFNSNHCGASGYHFLPQLFMHSPSPQHNVRPTVCTAGRWRRAVHTESRRRRFSLAAVPLMNWFLHPRPPPPPFFL